MGIRLRNLTPGWFVVFWIGVVPIAFAVVLTFGVVVPLGWNR